MELDAREKEYNRLTELKKAILKLREQNQNAVMSNNMNMYPMDGYDDANAGASKDQGKSLSKSTAAGRAMAGGLTNDTRQQGYISAIMLGLI